MLVTQASLFLSMFAYGEQVSVEDRTSRTGRLEFEPGASSRAFLQTKSGNTGELSETVVHPQTI